MLDSLGAMILNGLLGSILLRNPSALCSFFVWSRSSFLDTLMVKRAKPIEELWEEKGGKVFLFLVLTKVTPIGVFASSISFLSWCMVASDSSSAQWEILCIGHWKMTSWQEDASFKCKKHPFYSQKLQGVWNGISKDRIEKVGSNSQFLKYSSHDPNSKWHTLSLQKGGHTLVFGCDVSFAHHLVGVVKTYLLCQKFWQLDIIFHSHYANQCTKEYHNNLIVAFGNFNAIMNWSLQA